VSTTADAGRVTPKPEVQKVTRRQREREAKVRSMSGAAERQTIRKFDLWTVLKVSLCFNLAAMLVTVVAIVVLWILADVLGAVGKLESLVGDLTSTKNFSIFTPQLLYGGLLVGVVMVVFATIVTVLAAAFYNLFSDIVGGVEIIVSNGREQDE
jgi:hypothetical protein